MESKNNEQKLDYLESLGADIQGFDSQTVSFSTSEGDFECELENFEIGDTLADIQTRSDQYSCCGDILDPDYMICPTCKEHC